MQLSGDNGIITQAQNATYMQSIAVLEEYLNSYYVEHYDQMSTAESKVVALLGLEPTWFYHPKLNYVVDSDGVAHYFLIPENLPSEISSQIKDGKGNKEYRDYINCNDVYGVTSDLKVYYCKDGKDTMMGVSSEELDLDSPTRVIFAANSNWAKLISGKADTEIQAQNIKSVTSVSIDENSGITDLSEIYNIVGLKKLEISNIEISLSGIENLGNLEEIYLKNCKITDATAISSCDKLKNISLVNETQETVDNILDNMKGNNYSNLKRLEIYADSDSYKKLITDISQLASFTQTTKNSLTHLILKYEDISSLSFLEGFNALQELDITNNANITTLKGLTSKVLQNLYADNCNLGLNETEECSEENALYALTGCINLNNVQLRNNIHLKHINYLNSSNRSYSYLYLSGNTNYIVNEVIEIKDKYLSATISNIDAKYMDAINGTEIMDLKNLALTDSSEKFISLKGNTNVKSLRLDGNTNLSNSKIKEVLSTCTNIQYLSLKGLTQITSIDFVENMPNLKVLNIWDCSNLNDISILEKLRTENKQNLKTLKLNNSKIDLTKIQNTISNLNSSYLIGSYDLECKWGGYNGFVASYSVWKNLENCSNVTTIRGSYVDNRIDFGNNYVDLTNCTSLKEITLSYITVKLKIPDSVTSVNLGVNSIKSDLVFTSTSNLEVASIINAERQWTNNYFSNWCNRLSVCQKLSQITFGDSWYEDGSTSTITELKDLNLLKSCSSLKILKIYNMRNITHIEGIGELSQLTDLSIYNCSNLNDISDFECIYENEKLKNGTLNLNTLDLHNNSIENIEALSGYINLTELNLNQNRISNIYPLKNLSKLTSLNLSNNCIYDTDYYKDENGTDRIFNSTEVLALLFNSGLRSLYLENNYIEDFSNISNLKWDNKTGF